MSDQIRRTAKLTLASLLLIGGACALTGCETWKGLGKDVTSVGDSMQKDSNDDGGSEETVQEDE